MAKRVSNAFAAGATVPGVEPAADGDVDPVDDPDVPPEEHAPSASDAISNTPDSEPNRGRPRTARGQSIRAVAFRMRAG